MRTFIDRLRGKPPLPRGLKAATLLLYPLVLVFIVQMILFQNIGETLQWMFYYNADAMAVNYLAVFLITLMVYGLTNSMFWSTAPFTLICVIYALVNLFKMNATGIPVLFTDFKMALELVQISGMAGGAINFTKYCALGIALAAVMLGGILLFSRTMRSPGRLSRFMVSFVALLTALFLFLSPAAQGNVLSVFGMEFDSRAAQSTVNNQNGLLAGMYRTAVTSRVPEPVGYSEAYMEEILEQIRTSFPEQEAAEGRPNVVMILAESFFDVTQLDVEMEGDPMAAFRKIAGESLSGKFYSNTTGGGTGNVEIEALLGISARLIPYGNSMCYLSDEQYSTMPTLPEIFRQNGYKTMSLHTYNSTLFNRANSFPAMGFDACYFDDTLNDTSRIDGNYLSDDYLADSIIAQFEEKGEEPLFLYAISMENHSPYGGSKYGYESGFSLSSDLLTEEELALVDSVVTGIHHANLFLEKLVDYFAEQEEPTIICFYGDHLPGLAASNGGSIYTVLNYIENDEEGLYDPLSDIHAVTTDYLIWSNYQTAEEMAGTTERDTSAPFLGNLLVNCAGLKKSTFFRYLDSIMEEITLYSDDFFMDRAGNLSTEAPAAYDELLRIYEAIVYDAIYGEGYITAALAA